MSLACEEARPLPEKATSGRLEVRLRSIIHLAEDIRGFEFVDPAGHPLPPFTAGAHLDVHLPGGLIRQYSLCNDPAETHRYMVAVLRDGKGRGGSRAMHDQLKAGDRLAISAPRNHFELARGAGHHLFLAGGIGITPIMAMIAAVRARGESFHLYYCTRSPERTAFLPELRPLLASGQATVHHDGGDPANGLDLGLVLSRYRPGSHLYYCGPAGFLDAVERAASAWPAAARHCERFSAPAARPAQAEPDMPFQVELAGTGMRFQVPPGKTVVDVLEAHGIPVDVSCRSGYCGTCMTRYLEGEPVHRDSVLDEEDRREFVMICCCRAKNTLVLDL